MSRLSGHIVRLLVLALALVSSPAPAERVKDLAHIAGVRDNQLVGYGLVVGLDQTGDQTGQLPFTTQSLRSMLNRFGVNIPPDINLALKNVAAVVLERDPPGFREAGAGHRRDGLHDR